MRLSLDALTVLDAIARRGSFAAAADELHRVPSAVTYTVQKLEQDLDVTLFDRSGRRARLTPTGEELLREGRHLLHAAADLECRIKRVATGWETELRIAVSDLIPLARVYPLIEQFYQQNTVTQLRLSTEVYGGTWDALVSGRADLVIGACGEAPAGGGYATRSLGEMAFVFVVAPDHPLAAAQEPLGHDAVMGHRMVVSADSSRRLPARTSSLLSGQPLLTVPDMAAKCEAQRRGLGVGYIPRHMAGADIAAGRLVAKELESGIPPAQMFIAWRPSHRGKALRWFLNALTDPSVFAGLFPRTGSPELA